ncbi:hypothetical protein OG943_10390 [Amycolatopsis sp. NBC_00345]|uniref:hypothetical protein n=1 Tax=Amycolatopsis sp. NBC_00345 TaxID=2975955 RepID=UPI002E262D0D
MASVRLQRWKKSWSATGTPRSRQSQGFDQVSRLQAGDQVFDRVVDDLLDRRPHRLDAAGRERRVHHAALSGVLGIVHVQEGVDPARAFAHGRGAVRGLQRGEPWKRSQRAAGRPWQRIFGWVVAGPIGAGEQRWPRGHGSVLLPHIHEAIPFQGVHLRRGS